MHQLGDFVRFVVPHMVSDIPTMVNKFVHGELGFVAVFFLSKWWDRWIQTKPRSVWKSHVIMSWLVEFKDQKHTHLGVRWAYNHGIVQLFFSLGIIHYGISSGYYFMVYQLVFPVVIIINYSLYPLVI